jgi:hypothetical protein
MYKSTLVETSNNRLISKKNQLPTICMEGSLSVKPRLAQRRQSVSEPTTKERVPTLDYACARIAVKRESGTFSTTP